MHLNLLKMSQMHMSIHWAVTSTVMFACGLWCIAFVQEHHNCPQSVFLYISMVDLCICMSENWLQDSAVKDSLFVFGGNSLGVQTFAPSFLVLTPSTPFVLFIFHACSFTPLAPHHPHPRQPQPASCCSPSAPCSLSCRLGPVQIWRILLQGLTFLKPSNTYVYVSSIHDCDGHVYNVIRLCQTC